jgi:hypothetical protein
MKSIAILALATGVGVLTGCIPVKPANAVDAHDALQKSMVTINQAAASDQGQFDNPNYAAWSHFPVGSFATLTWRDTVKTSSGPMENIHERVTILRKVGPDAVHVEIREKSTFGHERHVDNSLIPSHIDVLPQPSGTQDVAAMGRTYHCTVYQMAMGHYQRVIYMSGEVPGGIVREDEPAVRGHTPVWTLTNVGQLP